MAETSESLIRFNVNGELMTADKYMERHNVDYYRAIHELNNIVNFARVELKQQNPT